jgi:hypothetical protein
MTDIQPLAQWNERDGRVAARPFVFFHVEYDAEEGRYRLVGRPPAVGKRAGFVNTTPGRWTLQLATATEPQLAVVKRGGRTYAYP